MDNQSPEAIINQEQVTLANLAAASQYTISGDTLTLTAGGNTLTFWGGCDHTSNCSVKSMMQARQSISERRN